MRKTEINKLTDEQMLDQLRQYYKEYEKIPRILDIEHGKIIAYRFGTWNKALSLALGADKVTSRNVSDEQILLAIRELNDKLGRPPRLRESKYGSTARRRFGSWNNTLERALGDDNVHVHHDYDRKKIVEGYKRLSKELGYAASSNDIIKDKRMPSLIYIRKEFGSIIDLANEAGLSKEVVERWHDYKLQDWTPEELIDGYKRLEKQLGRIPVSKDITDCKWLPNPHVFVRVFGSLTQMREDYDLAKPNSGQSPISKKTLVRQVAEFYKEHGRFPLKREFASYSNNSIDVLLARFQTSSVSTVWKEIVNDPYFQKIIENNTL